MKDLQISFDSEINPEDMNLLNNMSKRIFEWVCFTMNIGGYVPHIYEMDKNSIRFVIRRLAGTRCTLSFQAQIKIASIANMMFRVKQKTWPIAIMRDIAEGKYLEFWRINVTGETRKVTEDINEDDDIFVDLAEDESTTLSRLE
jgi:hypothetical protein